MAKDDKGKSLEDLKKDYEKIRKKYSLPSFKKLNEDFQIEKISEYETDILIREVRKFISEKFSNYLRFIETILHPINCPMFIFSIIKSLGQNEKKKLTDIYEKLVKNEIRLIEIDIDFSEEKEAKFIKESYEIWQEIKKDILEIMDVIKKNWDNKFKADKGSYFG